MTRIFRHAVVATVLAMAAAPAAFAHVTLETRQAPASSTYKAVLKVPHGCGGSPTVRIRVQIPEGVIGVKPQPKAGWELAIVKGPLAHPVQDSHGNMVTEAVREVIWSGGRLPDEHYDEFVFSLKLPDAPDTTLYFPTVQDCEAGVKRWIEIPEEGRSAADYKEPAPALRLTAAR